MIPTDGRCMRLTVSVLPGPLPSAMCQSRSAACDRGAARREHLRRAEFRIGRGWPLRFGFSAWMVAGLTSLGPLWLSVPMCSQLRRTCHAFMALAKGPPHSTNLAELAQCCAGRTLGLIGLSYEPHLRRTSCYDFSDMLASTAGLRKHSRWYTRQFDFQRSRNMTKTRYRLLGGSLFDGDALGCSQWIV